MPALKSADSFLADGSDKFHEMLANNLEAASRKAMPQVEIRFKDLAIAADVVVATKDGANELPTLVNTVTKAVMGMAKTKRVYHKDILHPVSGVFKPATMTLLLGQPGSGKSSLMKMLAGRFHEEKNITVGGSVTYNGTKREEVKKQIPQFVSYVNQRDYHFPQMTVQETMEFAHQACGGKVPQRVLDSLNSGTPEEIAQAKEIIEALYQVYPDVIVRQMGLANCKDTIVGNAMERGVSGGERKRVTIGEMEFGMKQVSLLDEISTGLDSAATFDIVKSQRSMAKSLKKTIVIALLQPSPEVFDLFDDVMIMNEGYVMYHGPRAEALSYFESFGFKCPVGRDVADFLLDLGTPQQHQYAVPGMNNQPRYPADYAALFQESTIYRYMIEHVQGPVHPLLLHDGAHHVQNAPQFQLDFKTSTLNLVRRQTQVLYRNKVFIQSRVVMILLMGFLYSTTFYQVNPNLAQVVYGVIFQAILFLGLGQIALLPSYFDSRAIYYKQRSANFYRTSSFVISQTITQLPMSICEAIVFGSIIYWVSGLVSDVGAFLIFELVLLITNVLFATWFFFIAVVSPNLDVANPLSMVCVLFFIIFAGFIVQSGDIPDYFIWLYWIDPIMWAMRALATNQYSNSEFQVCNYRGVEYCATNGGKKMGTIQLEQFGMPTGREWIWYGVIYMVALYFLFVGLSIIGLERIRYDNVHGALSEEQLMDEEEEKEAYKKMPATPVGSQASDAVIVPVQEFVPVTLAFKDLHYFVPNPTKGEPELELLKGVSGYALPGTVTALMGSSGAGKTTLMDVIAGRKTGGKIVGDILLNGYKATDLAIRRCTGYCEQMDIHCESATFREALIFSSMLRQSSDIPTATKLAHAEECLRLLEMHTIADSIIRGSSVEQMKRLTIGVELAAAPSVLFLDEPTSGLDARSAKIIMTGIRNIASTGRTVVCTIHQPSKEVFEMFDNLLLLKRGGYTVFFGELGHKSANLMEYFMRIPGTPSMAPGYNPATWMLEVIGAGVETKVTNTTDYVEVFQHSEEYKQLQAGLAIHTLPRADVPEMNFSSKRAASNTVQFQYVLLRYIRMYWRTPTYNLTRVMLSIFLAVLFGLIFLSVDYTTYSGVVGGSGMVFMTTLFVGIIAFNSIVPITIDERASYYRERASQTYNALWYFLAGTIVEIPYVLVTTLIFTVIYYPFVGFTGSVGDVIIYWLLLSLYSLFNVYMGQLFAFALPTMDVAMSVGALFNSIFILFMGFNPPTSAIPKAYKWLATITPPKYSLSVLVAEVFAKCENGHGMGCATMSGVPPATLAQMNKTSVTVKEFTEFFFEMKYDNGTKYTWIVFAVIILFRVWTLLALRYINHQKR